MRQGNTIAVNRRARFDYDIVDIFEAGIVLTGNEIKSLRQGHISLRESYAKPESGEIWLINSHISHYSSGSTQDSPTRPRKLLLHKDQVRYMTKQVSEKSLTIVPLKMYFKKHLAKIEVGLAKGRKRHDKRRVLIERYREREAKEATG